jgi:hypothetical protein
MILEELIHLFNEMKIPVESGVFSEVAPNQYCVLIPLSDEFELYANNQPMIDVQEVRISFFSKGNYLNVKKKIINYLLRSEFTITSRVFLGFDKETNYYHVAIDVAKHYEMEEI